MIYNKAKQILWPQTIGHWLLHFAIFAVVALSIALYVNKAASQDGALLYDGADAINVITTSCDGTQIIAGFNGGFEYSTDGGDSWNSEVLSENVTDADFTCSGNDYIVSTHAYLVEKNKIYTGSSLANLYLVSSSDYVSGEATVDIADNYNFVYVYSVDVPGSPIEVNTPWIVENWLSDDVNVTAPFLDGTISNEGSEFFLVDNSGNLIKYFSNDTNAVVSGISGVSKVEVSGDGLVVAVTYEYGILISSDGGETFSPVSNDLIDNTYPFVDVAVSDDGMVIAAAETVTVNGTAGYLYYSIDGGDTWVLKANSDNAWSDITISDDGTIIYAATSDGKIYSYLPTNNNGGSSDYDVGSLGTGSWHGVASSDDGTKLVVVENGANVYTSTNSGTSWTIRYGAGTRDWWSVTSSADGTKLAATTWGEGYVYTSTDSGVTWTERTGVGASAWYDIASSDDGTKLAVASNGGYIKTSSDGGATWTQRTSAGSRNWRNIASSDDGAKLVAVVASGGYVYTSSDSGATWTQRTSLGTGGTPNGWHSVASSADGTKIVAGTYGGYLFTSTDSGANWTTRTGAGTGNWFGLDMSSDGSVIVAANNGGYIYASNDGGATWTEQTDLDSRDWWTVALSADGTKLIADTQSGTVYTDSNLILNGVSLPSLTTELVSGITQTSATLNGNVTDTGGETLTAKGFAYGLSDTFGATTTTSDGLDQNGGFAIEISGLTCGTSYYYKAFGTNSAGTFADNYLIFTTLDCPVVTTSPASGITQSGAVLNGAVTDLNGTFATERGFAYGTTVSYGATTSQSGTFEEESYSANLSGLTCGTTYYFRAYATDSNWTSVGNGRSFTTSSCTAPSITTSSAGSITQTSAVLNGTITSIGGINPTVRGFNYGTSQIYTATSSTSGNYGIGTYNATITGLTCGTTYNFRAFAENTVGRGNGSNTSFTTSACPSSPPPEEEEEPDPEPEPEVEAETPVVIDRGGTLVSRPASTSGGGNTASGGTPVSTVTDGKPLYAISLPGSITLDTGTNPASGSGAGGSEPVVLWEVVPLADTFPRELSLGMRGRDVQALQIFLNTVGYIIANAGPGSPGLETEYYGQLTKSALSRYQSYFKLPATGKLDWDTIKFISAD